MASLAAAVRVFLLADPAIAGIVGTRIYPEQLPQNGTLPAIAYSLDFEPEHNLDDDTEAGFGQLDLVCVGTSFDELEALGDAIRARCNGAHSITALGRTFGVRFIRKTSALTPSVSGGESGTYLLTVTLETSEAG